MSWPAWSRGRWRRQLRWTSAFGSCRDAVALTGDAGKVGSGRSCDSGKERKGDAWEGREEIPGVGGRGDGRRKEGSATGGHRERDRVRGGDARTWRPRAIRATPWCRTDDSPVGSF